VASGQVPIRACAGKRCGDPGIRRPACVGLARAFLGRAVSRDDRDLFLQDSDSSVNSPLPPFGGNYHGDSGILTRCAYYQPRLSCSWPHPRQASPPLLRLVPKPRRGRRRPKTRIVFPTARSRSFSSQSPSRIAKETVRAHTAAPAMDPAAANVAPTAAKADPRPSVFPKTSAPEWFSATETSTPRIDPVVAAQTRLYWRVNYS
jgi:hypothetical protein